MDDFQSLSSPEEREVLIAFCDLTGYSRFSEQKSSLEMFDIVSAYCEVVGDTVEPAGGRVVKFIGDAALIVFSRERVSAGIRALFELKRTVEDRLNSAGYPAKLHVKAHFGPAALGLLGTRTEKRFDLIGNSVNSAALLVSRGFSISPEAFRQLDSATRTLFKKHTPAVRYIPVDEPHRD